MRRRNERPTTTDEGMPGGPLSLEELMARPRPAEVPAQPTDEELAAQVADNPDAAPLLTDEELANAEQPGRKQGVFIRLDADVVERLRASGKGWQTRVNAILRHSVMSWDEGTVESVQGLSKTRNDIAQGIQALERAAAVVREMAEQEYVVARRGKRKS